MRNPSAITFPPANVGVLAMSDVLALSQEERIMHCAGIVRAASKSFVVLGKLFRAIQRNLGEGEKIFGVLQAAGVSKGTISNASYAARTFDLVELDLLAEAEFDDMTSRDFIRMARLCDQHRNEIGGQRKAVEAFRAGPAPKEEDVAIELLTSGEAPIDEEGFRDRVEKLRTGRDRYHFDLADTLREGRERLGADFVEEALSDAGIEHADALRAAAISELPAEMVNDALDPDHYLVVQQAKLGGKERDEWLRKAEEHDLTPSNLRRSIEAGTVVTPEVAASASGRASGIITVENVRFQFDRWLQKNTATDPWTGWEDHLKERLLEELLPIHALCESVIASLKANAAQAGGSGRIVPFAAAA